MQLFEGDSPIVHWWLLWLFRFCKILPAFYSCRCPGARQATWGSNVRRSVQRAGQPQIAPRHASHHNHHHHHHDHHHHHNHHRHQRWGSNCTETCSCTKGTMCHHVTGECLPCAPGLWGDACKEKCRWENLFSSISIHCYQKCLTKDDFQLLFLKLLI